MALGMLFTRAILPSITWCRIAVTMGCAGFVAGFAVIIPLVPGEMVSNGLFIPFLGLILFGLAHSKSKVLNHPFAIRLGDASYSLYLLHIPMWNWFYQIDLHLTHIKGSAPAPFFFTYLATVIGLSLLSSRFIEAPARRFLRNCLSPTSYRIEIDLNPDVIEPSSQRISRTG